MLRSRFVIIGAFLGVVSGEAASQPFLHGQYIDGGATHAGLAPAPPPTPHVDYYGGPVVSNMEVVIVLWGTGTYLPQVTSSSTPSMSSFYQQVLNSPYIDSLDYEYNTYVHHSMQGGTEQFIHYGAFLSKITITPSNSATNLSDSNIQIELINQIHAGHLPAPTHDAAGDANTYYAVFFPPGITITDPNGKTSCAASNGFCSYHYTANGGSGIFKFVYSVQPDMQAGSGCAGTACGPGTAFQNYMSTASHEMAETITDPEIGFVTMNAPPLAWYDTNYGEVADYCTGQQASILGGDGQTYTVQKLWYNGVGCTTTIPVRDFTISLSSSYVTVPQGSATSATISTTQVGPQGYLLFSTTGASGGLTVTPNPVAGLAGSGSTLMISAAAGTPVGEQTITVTGETVVAGITYTELGASERVHSTQLKVYVTDVGNGPFAASGGGFRVNTTTGSESEPAVGMDQSGAFVVAWKSGTYDVLAQRYARSGAPLAGEFRVNSYTSAGANEPAVTGSAAGKFTVVWRAGSEIEGQRYASGVPQGSEFRVNSAVGYYEAKPRVGSDWDGNFVVAWGRAAAGPSSSFDPWVRLFSASGAPRGGEFRVDRILEAFPPPGFYIDGNAWAPPSVAVTPPGTFVVSWASNAAPSAAGAVWAATFDANGAFGGEFAPNQYGAAAGAPPSVAIGAGGNFVVTWSGTYLWGQRYSPNVSALGGAFRVDAGAPNPPLSEKIVTDSAGNFVFVWNDAATAQIQARRYASSGAPLGETFRVDASTGAPVQLGDVAMDPKGDFVVVWQQGSSPSDVYARLYCGSLAGDLDGSGAIDVADVFYLINHLFAGGPAPLGGADVNGDGMVDVADVFYLINTLFAGGPLPACA
jgi:hypothetical protein